MPGFRHVVMFKYSDEATPEIKANIQKGLEALPSFIKEVKAFKCGPDAGVSPGNADFVVVADFDDVEGYKVYASHPEHVRVVGMIKSVLVQRTAVQFHL